MSEPPAEAIEVLARRVELLRALSDGPRTKRDLVASWPVSRSTVDRAVRNLESLGFVERDTAVSLTLQGRLVLDAFEELAGTVTAVDAADPLLDPLSTDATIDTVLLQDADVIGPDPVSPQRPYVAYQELVADATAVRGYAPVVLEDNVPVFRKRVVDDGVAVDLTLSPDALEELVSSHAATVEAVLDTGRMTLRRATTTLEYGLMLVEQTERTVVCALFYDDRGLVGSLHNDSSDAVRWAEGVYERIREDAEPVAD